MSERKNPIKIELVNKDEFKITIKLDNWELSKLVTESALKELQKEINNATGLTKISDTFNCNGDDSRKIKDFWDNKGLSEKCKKECIFKWVECFNCVIKCQSPLERDLFLELRKNNFHPILQRRFNKNGDFYDFPDKIDFENILTIPDFYIEGKEKLCIYADGHTYHERTENQALRDRNIDRELQRFGFKVLRYTGQEIRKNCSLVVENIKKNIE